MYPVLSEEHTCLCHSVVRTDFIAVVNSNAAGSVRTDQGLYSTVQYCARIRAKLNYNYGVSGTIIY